MPLVDLSFGDALDRLSVLKVKMKSLNDDYCKFGIVSKEASQLDDAILSWCHNNNISNELYEKHLSTLVEINQCGWDQVEMVRTALDAKDSPSINAAHLQMIQINDHRILAKNNADKSVNYSFHEVKSYL